MTAPNLTLARRHYERLAREAERSACRSDAFCRCRKCRPPLGDTGVIGFRNGLLLGGAFWMLVALMVAAITTAASSAPPSAEGTTAPVVEADRAQGSEDAR